MNFYLKWAFKNLLRSRNRTISISVLIVVTSMIFYLGVALLSGSNRQMKNMLRSFNGDILVKSKYDEVNLYPIADKIKNVLGIDAKHYVGEECELDCKVITRHSYKDGKIIGISDVFIDNLNGSVEWQNKYKTLKEGQVIIEKRFAEDLRIKTGEYFTVTYTNPHGAINTGTFRLANIFLGNIYEHAGKIFVPISDAQKLSLVDNYVNVLKIYNNTDKTYKDVQDILSRHSSDLFIWDKDGINQINLFYEVFNFANKFLVGIIIIVIIVLLFVEYLAFQNLYLMIFNERKNEISVLATYGMRMNSFFKITSWETLLLLIIGNITGLIFSLIISYFLSSITLSRYIDEIVAILGGPRLNFSFSTLNIVPIFIVISLIGLVSTYRSLKKFIGIEILEIRRGI